MPNFFDGSIVHIAWTPSLINRLERSIRWFGSNIKGRLQQQLCNPCQGRDRGSIPLHLANLSGVSLVVKQVKQKSLPETTKESLQPISD